MTLTEKLNEVSQILTLENAAESVFAVDRGQSVAESFPVASIALITLRDSRVTFILRDGTEIQSKPSDSLLTIARRLKAYPQFMRTHNRFIVNLDEVDFISQVRAGEFQLTFFNGTTAPLLQNQKAVKDYFSLPSLEHVIPWNERLQAVIKEKLRDFDSDIRMMETDTLRSLFSDGTGQLVTKQLIGNIVWQAYHWVKSGRLPPFDGNIRSFWYSHIKPVLARLLPDVGDNQYQGMIGVFSQYVGDYHLFSYADFGFIDDNDALRFIGDQHPQVIIFAEKRGHWRTLQKIQAQTGATVISLGGQPSLMTTEYFVEDLAQVIDLKQTFHLISDVDYDPSGQIIAESFREQLGKMGIRDTTMTHIIMPEHFTPEELKFFKFAVPQESPSDRKKVRNWLNPSPKLQRLLGRKPAGIVDEFGVRQPWGLESDAMPKDRLIQYATTFAKDALSPSPQAHIPIKPNGFQYLMI